MPRHEIDKSSKWMIQHHGSALLWMGGARRVRRCRALQAELVQPRQLPDGLLEVWFADSKQPDHVLLEIATYPEPRIAEQAMDDLMLAYQHLRKLPDLLVLVLAQRGSEPVLDRQELHSRLGWAGLGGSWKVVPVWELSAEELLAANDVGLVPWASLARYDGPPEALLRQCRQHIDRQAPLAEQPNLLAVSQVLARLRYADPQVLALLGGSRVMIESPLIQELLASNMQTSILQFLEARFGSVPRDLEARLRLVQDPDQLTPLIKKAAVCADPQSFAAALPRLPESSRRSSRRQPKKPG